MSFECNAGTRCECSWFSERSFSCESVTQTLKARVTTALGAIKEPDFVTDSNVLQKIYITICENYTARGLTFATDTMPAVPSLMSRFALATIMLGYGNIICFSPFNGRL